MTAETHAIDVMALFMEDLPQFPGFMGRGGKAMNQEDPQVGQGFMVEEIREQIRLTYARTEGLLSHILCKKQSSLKVRLETHFLALLKTLYHINFHMGIVSLGTDGQLPLT